MSRNSIIYPAFVALLVGSWLNTHGCSAQSTTLLPLEPQKIKQAQQLYREGIAKKDSSQIAEAYYVYGRAYGTTGDFLTSDQYYWKAIRLREPKGATHELGMLYIRLAGNQEAQGYISQAMQYTWAAKAVFVPVNSRKGLMHCYSLLARLHAWYQKHPQTKLRNQPGHRTDDSTRYYARIFHQLALSTNDTLNLAFIYSMDDYLDALFPNDSALQTRKRYWALAVYRKKRWFAHEMSMLIAFANDALRNKRYAGGHRLLAEAQKLEPMAHEDNLTSSLWGAWADYYRLTGNWQQAFVYQQKRYKMDMHRASADREGAISRLAMEYETAKKDIYLTSQRRELTLRTESLTNYERFLVMLSILLAAAVAMGVVFFRLSQKNQRISKRNATLVREQNHRVKNNLQVVSSLLSLQANQLTDRATQNAVEESQLRVQAMATLHRRLYDGDQLVQVYLPDYISDVVEYVLNAFGHRQLEPEYDIQPISLSADDAMPLGLILNELTTNACKYAFPDHAEPLYRVCCHQQNGLITLAVSDNGPGYSPDLQGNPKQSPSFGIRLIQMQAEQLRASFGFTSAGGTLFTLRFTVS